MRYLISLPDVTPWAYFTLIVVAFLLLYNLLDALKHKEQVWVAIFSILYIILAIRVIISGVKFLF